MRTLPDGFAAHLSGATTLATCWRIIRADGVRLGFTDHDRPLTFDGVVFEASAGVETAARDTSADFAVDNTAGLGALTSDAIDEEDLLAGRFDGAVVEIWSVNWVDTEERFLVFSGSLGEIARRDGAFEAEVRGLKATLEETRGRIYQRTCDAALGDARCGVALHDAAYSADGSIVTVQTETEFVASGLAGFEGGWFTLGRLSWSTGARAGLIDRIVRHTDRDGEIRLVVSERAAAPIAPGDAFTATAGCDKRFATCREKFGNVLNFRGFPLMPGDDYVYGYPSPGDVLDGGRR